MQRAGEQVAVAVPTRLAVNNSAAIMAAVQAGGGIGLVPDFAASSALDGAMVTRLLPDWEMCEPYTGAVHAVYIPGRHIALKNRVFIDYLAACAVSNPLPSNPVSC
jgi:DNA-binding transcriptional LysR family regulator